MQLFTRRISRIALFLAVLWLQCASLAAQPAQGSNKTLASKVAPISDSLATKETRALYGNLHKIAKHAILFGHQDDLAYGVHWKYKKDSSDVYSLTGDYPALYGWDLSGLESDSDKDIDGTPFKLTRTLMEKSYAEGGVITLSWHGPSPLGEGKTAWDTTHGTVKSILPGGVNNALYNSWLDKLSRFIGSLKGPHKENIPVLFRPFHELTGNWFWWCANTCTPAEFKSLWRYTVDYLRIKKNLHNLIIVYNTSDNFKGRQGFLERYPGDGYADILSFDSYQYEDPSTSDKFEKQLDLQLGVIESIAMEKGKLTALAETGYERIPYAKWWTEKLMKGIGSHKISYVLVWRNAGEIGTPEKPHVHYYVPVKGDVSAKDFIKFYDLPNTFFLKNVSREKLYQ